jgi:hypothetical protein
MPWVVEGLNHQPHLISKAQSGDSDLVSDESQEDVRAHQELGTIHLGILSQAKNFPILAKSPLQAALQAAHSPGEDTNGFKFYPVLDRPDPNDPSMQQRFHGQAIDW